MQHGLKELRLPAFDRLDHHPTEDAFMIPGMGAQPMPPPKYVPANDNVPDVGDVAIINGEVCRYDGHDWPVYVTTWDGRWSVATVESGPAATLIGRGDLKLAPPRSVPVDQPEYKSRAWRPGDPNGCADDLVTTTLAPLELVGWSAVPANSPGNSNPFSGIGERHGDFMQTYTGRKFWPMDPRANEVCIRDIAHSLSLQCRYAGHCRRFYSVAEHCVLMARWLISAGRDVALWGLLHDASEAFLIDVPRPVKPFLYGYRDAEAKVMAAICQRFGLPLEMPAIVHEADERIIADELVNLVRMQWHARHDDPLGVALHYWSPAEAEEEFLETFKALTGARA